MHRVFFATICLSLLGLAACDSRSNSANSASESPSSQAPSASAVPALIVYKNASCGCCRAWVEHMNRAGFKTEVHDLDNLASVKERAGIPTGMGSCHTAHVGRYFIEGHVPAEDVKRLLAEHPDAKGLTVPGMPVGSPGMELPSGKVEPYDVYLVAADGTTSVYAHHE